MKTPSDFNAQKKLLDTAVGQCGSGGLRYAAAMYFYREHLMPAEMLEIYRRCSKFDSEDPVAWADYEGISLPQITRAKGAL